MRTLLTLGLFLAWSSSAFAELRIIGVHVTRDADSKIHVSIASAEAREKRTAATVDEAAEILRQAKGWGSSVEVGILAHNIGLQEYFPLLKAISENPRLHLLFVEGRKPDFINDNIKKRIEQGGAGQPATAPEPKPEGQDKSQPESKPASR